MLTDFYRCYITFSLANMCREPSDKMKKVYGFDNMDSRVSFIFRDRKDGKVDIFVRAYKFRDINKLVDYLHDEYSFPAVIDLLYDDDVLVYIGVDESFVGTLLGYFKMVNPYSVDEVSTLYLNRNMFSNDQLTHCIEFEDIKWFYRNLLVDCNIFPKLCLLDIEDEVLVFYFDDAGDIGRAIKELSGYFLLDDMKDVYIKNNKHQYKLICRMDRNRMCSEFISRFVSNYSLLYFDLTKRQALKKIESFKAYINSLGITEEL